jgi:GDP-4-dehydro-6-deoxy-D-mannose reductase
VSPMPAPILVTGAAGFVGGHLLNLLAQQSHPLVGCFHPAAAPRYPRPDVAWVPLDLLNREAVAHILAEKLPDAIYHLAGVAHVAQSWQNPAHAYEGNVLATHYLFEALRTHELRPRVFVSGSAMIYCPQDRPIREDDALGPTSPYATSKLAQEMLAQRAWEMDGVPTVIARSFNHVGPGQDASYVAPGIAKQIALIEAGRQDPVITMGNLQPKRDLTDVRDTVRAYVAMMERAQPGQPYNVCSGKGLSIAELVETFIARARTSVRVVQDPARFRPNDVPLLVGDHQRLTADTGWRPGIPFERTVDDLLEYWRLQVRTQ